MIGVIVVIGWCCVSSCANSGRGAVNVIWDVVVVVRWWKVQCGFGCGRVVLCVCGMGNRFGVVVVCV